MMDATWAVIPVKDLAAAKSRLAPALRSEHRRQLVVHMLEDVLAAVSAVIPASRILVVTPDPDIGALAASSGALALGEAALVDVEGTPAEGPLNAAIAAGLSHILERGGERVLILPADVPLATGDDIARVLADASPGSAHMVIVPSADGEGTNALALSPPGILAPRFGPDSFAAHLAAAAARRIDTRVLHIPGLAADIDTPADLARFMSGRLPERYAFLRAACGGRLPTTVPGGEP